MIAHNITHHLCCPGKLSLMNNRRAAHKHLMIAVEALNANAGFIGGHHIGVAKVDDDGRFSDCEWHMRAFQHVCQRTPADFDAEQIAQHAFKPRK